MPLLQRQREPVHEINAVRVRRAHGGVAARRLDGLVELDEAAGKAQEAVVICRKRVVDAPPLQSRPRVLVPRKRAVRHDERVVPRRRRALRRRRIRIDLHRLPRRSRADVVDRRAKLDKRLDDFQAHGILAQRRLVRVDGVLPLAGFVVQLAQERVRLSAAELPDDPLERGDGAAPLIEFVAALGLAEPQRGVGFAVAARVALARHAVMSLCALPLALPGQSVGEECERLCVGPERQQQPRRNGRRRPELVGEERPDLRCQARHVVRAELHLPPLCHRREPCAAARFQRREFNRG
mmetsp:Transcript_16362/g.57123  ORF Transcript_16362/g.57123 Transcript_16362/m.57123 type:complete len:295 (-) Transcript_16362:8-892(-)